MGEFLDAMWRDGAAGMEVRVDQRRQRRRRLDGRIERDAQLGEERKVGTEAGGDDDAVEFETDWLTRQPSSLSTPLLRNAQKIFVPGASSRNSINASATLMAECPPPMTSTRLPAYFSRSAPTTSGMP